jgi:ABC-type multidrug transport system ATPase subunit
MTLPALMTVNGLDFGYPGHTLFANWSCQLVPGVSLLKGDGGTGKTTLLRLLSGALPVRAGQLAIDGVSIKDLAAYQRQVFWAEPRSAELAALDQITPLDYFASLKSRYAGLQADLPGHLLEGLGLREHINKPFFMLSTGSKRKVLLAAAFTSNAAVTLLDEPFAALDKPSISFVMALLDEQAASHQRAWLVAHYDSPCNAPLAGTIDLDI